MAKLTPKLEIQQACGFTPSRKGGIVAEPRIILIQFRVTAKDFDSLCRAAKAAGADSPERWIRATVIGIAKKVTCETGCVEGPGHSGRCVGRDGHGLPT